MGWDRVGPFAQSLLGQLPPEFLRQIRHGELPAGVRARVDRWMDEMPDEAARQVQRVLGGAREVVGQLRTWADQRTAPSLGAINATGCFFDPRVGSLPLGEGVTAVWEVCGHQSALSDGPGRDRVRRALAGRAERLLGRPAVAAANFEAAVAAAVAALGESPLYCPRWSAARVLGGPSLPDLLRDAGGRVVEFGAADDGTLDAWEAAGEGAALVVLDTALDELPPAARERLRGGGGFRLVVASRTWPVANVLGPEAPPWPAIGELWEAGAEAVVMPTHRTLGGPVGGLVLGTRDVIERVESAPAWRWLCAGALDEAALALVLRGWEEDAEARVPLVGMLRRSEENLRHRGEQLAVRLAACEALRSARVTQAAARCWPGGGPLLPSRQLRLRHRALAADAWARRLAADRPAVLAGVEGDELVLDLRTVEPAAEGALVAAVTGGNAAAEG